MRCTRTSVPTATPATLPSGGAGEYALGLSFEYRANKTKRDGAPIDIVLPAEGLGWDMEATAIVASTKKPEAAKALVDWAVTRKANELYAANFAVVALPGVQEKLEFINTNIEKQLIKNDFEWAASNRERILAEWRKRYEGKAAHRRPPQSCRIGRSDRGTCAAHAGHRQAFRGDHGADRVDLDIGPQEFVCLLGPSGCGKTTLLRVLCGIETANAGDITLHGRDITAQPAAMRRFGVVFQSYALFPNFSVENVAYGLCATGGPPQRPGP